MCWRNRLLQPVEQGKEEQIRRMMVIMVAANYTVPCRSEGFDLNTEQEGKPLERFD